MHRCITPARLRPRRRHSRGSALRSLAVARRFTGRCETTTRRRSRGCAARTPGAFEVAHALARGGKALRQSARARRVVRPRRGRRRRSAASPPRTSIASGAGRGAGSWSSTTTTTSAATRSATSSTSGGPHAPRLRRDQSIDGVPAEFQRRSVNGLLRELGDRHPDRLRTDSSSDWLGTQLGLQAGGVLFDRGALRRAIVLLRGRDVLDGPRAGRCLCRSNARTHLSVARRTRAPKLKAFRLADARRARGQVEPASARPWDCTCTSLHRLVLT